MPKSWKRLRISPGDEQAALVATRLVASSGPAREQHRSHRPDIKLRVFRSTRTRSSVVAFQRELMLSPDARCCKADVPAASNHFRKCHRRECQRALDLSAFRGKPEVNGARSERRD